MTTLRYLTERGNHVNQAGRIGVVSILAGAVAAAVDFLYAGNHFATEVALGKWGGTLHTVAVPPWLMLDVPCAFLFGAVWAFFTLRSAILSNPTDGRAFFVGFSVGLLAGLSAFMLLHSNMLIFSALAGVAVGVPTACVFALIGAFIYSSFSGEREVKLFPDVMGGAVTGAGAMVSLAIAVTTGPGVGLVCELAYIIPSWGGFALFLVLRRSGLFGPEHLWSPAHPYVGR